MRYRKLTANQLAKLEETIRSFPDGRVSELARHTGYSIGFVSKARYLVISKPDVWKSCVSGMMTVNMGYQLNTFH